MIYVQSEGCYKENNWEQHHDQLKGCPLKVKIDEAGEQEEFQYGKADADDLGAVEPEVEEEVVGRKWNYAINKNNPYILSWVPFKKDQEKKYGYNWREKTYVLNSIYDGCF